MKGYIKVKTSDVEQSVKNYANAWYKSKQAFIDFQKMKQNEVCRGFLWFRTNAWDKHYEAARYGTSDIIIGLSPDTKIYLKDVDLKEYHSCKHLISSEDGYAMVDNDIAGFIERWRDYER